MSENPFVDDRDRQGTLDVGDAAARTDDRDGSIMGSDAFADDRDGGGDAGEQFNLFAEEEEVDGQASLGGGQATRESEGFFGTESPPSAQSGTGARSTPEIFQQAPGELAAGYELARTRTEGDGRVREVRFERESPRDPFDREIIDVQEIAGQFEIYQGVDGGSLDVDDGDRTPAFSVDQPNDPASIFDAAFQLSEEDAAPDVERADRELAAARAGALTPDGDDQQPRTIDVQSLDSANEIRERYSEYLHPDDHAGRTSVKFVADTPQGAIRQARAAADETAAERSRSQSVSLTERERDQIKSIGGFSQSRTTANWRSAKGVFEREGLGDQFPDAIGSINDYDDPIEGAEAYVERHKSRQAEAGVGGVGARDVGETDIVDRQRAGRAAAREQQSLEASAIEGAKRGHQEAVDALVFEAGWDRSEAEALGQQVDDPASSMTEPEFQRIVDAEIKRSRSSGRFAHDPNQTTLPGVERRRTSGRFVSSPLADTEIGRNTETGRFTSRGDR